MAARGRHTLAQAGWVIGLLVALVALVAPAALGAPDAQVGVLAPSAVDADGPAEAATAGSAVTRVPMAMPSARRRIAGWYSVLGAPPDGDASTVTFECVRVQGKAGPVAMRSAVLVRGTAQFGFDDLPPSAAGHRLTARVRGLADVSMHVPGDDDIIDIHLQAVGWPSVELRVVTEGQWICPELPVVLREVTTSRAWTARADAAGLAQFPALPVGEYDVSFGSPARAVRSAHRVVVHAPTALDQAQQVFAVAPERTRLRVAIRDVDGAPVAGAEARLVAEHDPDAMHSRGTSESGEATFEDLLPGRWRLSVVAGGLQTHLQVLSLPRSTILPLAVTLSRASARKRS